MQRVKCPADSPLSAVDTKWAQRHTNPAELVPGATVLTETDPHVTLNLFKEGYDLAASQDRKRTAGTELRARKPQVSAVPRPSFS